ncbi:hypothetical protein MPSEU_000375000 [Mayamaea pseudoterrestris]|nr:hypothetical protein MPSEU_000375000 [Mayamaea pseudoterrestris]
MTKKSSAQIKRNLKRAEARGDVYVPPTSATKVEASPNKGGDSSLDARRATAQKLYDTLKALESNPDINAKDRRSEKRKAMAIANEESGMAAEELLDWFGIERKTNNKSDSTSKIQANEKVPNLRHSRHIPYIAFIGQLSFTTTKEMLYEHIHKALANEKLHVTLDTLRIRLLNDAKTKKSRGMAFVEVFDPEILYALLKLHHTMLDSRRINVERSTGGGKEGKKEKIELFRKDQQAFMLSQVQQIIMEYNSRKEIAVGELDDTAILVCTRHSPVIVQAALDLYVEKSGRDMDNPSAYFTFLITKMAEEVVDATQDTSERQRMGGDREHRKRPRGQSATETPLLSLKQDTDFARSGIDMSVSESGGDLSLIFPSSKRGRGRGR